MRGGSRRAGTGSAIVAISGVGVLGLVIIHQHAVARAFQIVELAGVGRPPEQRADAEHQQDAQRNQQLKTFHGDDVLIRERDGPPQGAAGR